MEISRTYTVNFPEKGGRFAKKYPALVGVPYIRSPDLKYHRLANRYFLDRALGGWVPENRNADGYKPILAQSSLKTYAQALIDFLKYSDHFELDLKTCSYRQHILGGYQKRMLERVWPLSDIGVRGSTPVSRVQQACDYLSWLANQGFREPFQVPYETITANFGGHQFAIRGSSKQRQARIGRTPRTQTLLTMPTDEEVKTWLLKVRQKHRDPVWKLICESILLSGMRREEVVCLRNDTLPLMKKDWSIPNKYAPDEHKKVLIKIKFGCKGPDLGFDHDDKVGPERTIGIPLSLAEKWHEYRLKGRNAAFAKWMVGATGSGRKQRAENCVHLFLDPGSGAKITGKKLSRIWTSVERPIGWGPRATGGHVRLFGEPCQSGLGRLRDQPRWRI